MKLRVLAVMQVSPGPSTPMCPPKHAPQVAGVFHRAVRDNIRYAKPDAAETSEIGESALSSKLQAC